MTRDLSIKGVVNAFKIYGICYRALVAENILRIIFLAIVLLKLQLIHLDPINGSHINRADVVAFTIAKDSDYHANATGPTERMQGVFL